jgi:hypothetical protein
MDDFAVLEATHHMRDGIDFADMGQELVTQSLAFRSPGDQSGNVDELEGCRQYPLRPDDLGQLRQTRIRYRHHPGIGLDGAERKIGRSDSGFGQGIEKSRFTDIRQSDDTAFDSHKYLELVRKR